MKKQTFLWSGLFAVLLLLTACTTHHTLTAIDRSRIVVDSLFDASPDPVAFSVISPYKDRVDPIMSPVVGTAAHDMAALRPESDLSNLLADILLWASRDYGEQPVMSVYNMGGIRAALTKGPVTYGDILDVAPFENKISFVTLSGTNLLELFNQIAAKGGEGVSHGVQLVITPDSSLVSARLHGQPIDPDASYRIAAVDYIIQGNDGLSVFTKGTDKVLPTKESNNTRSIIIRYFQEQTAQGRPISSQIEGRIRVEEKEINESNN